MNPSVIDIALEEENFVRKNRCMSAQNDGISEVISSNIHRLMAINFEVNNCYTNIYHLITKSQG